MGAVQFSSPGSKMTFPAKNEEMSQMPTTQSRQALLVEEQSQPRFSKPMTFINLKAEQ